MAQHRTLKYAQGQGGQRGEVSYYSYTIQVTSSTAFEFILGPPGGYTNEAASDFDKILRSIRENTNSAGRSSGSPLVPGSKKGSIW